MTTGSIARTLRVGMFKRAATADPRAVSDFGVVRTLSRANPYFWDVALAAFLFAADVAEMRFLHSLYWSEREIASFPILVAVATLRAGALGFRRRYPVQVSILISTTLITFPTHGLSYLFESYAPALSPALAGDPGWWPTALGWTSILEGLVGVYTVTALRGRSAGAWTFVWNWICLQPWLLPQILTYGPAAVLYHPLIVGIAFYLGDVRRRLLAAFSEVAERSDRIDQGRLKDAEDAVRNERSEMSAELQDVVARNLRKMVDKAMEARRNLASSETELLVRSIEEIEHTGRAALSDARRALGLLRDETASPPLKPAAHHGGGKPETPTTSDAVSVEKESSTGSLKRVSATDVSFVVLLMILMISEIGLDQSAPPWSAIGRAAHLPDVSAMLLLTIPLVFRRLTPLPVAILVCGGFAIHALVGHFFTLSELIALLAAVYSVWAVRGGGWEGVLSLIIAALVVPLARAQLAGVFQFGLLTVYFPYLAAACFLGWQERRLELALELKMGQEQELERLAEAELERARTEERLRIARELHDVTAHSLSVMTIQAGAARMVADKQPEKALRALSAVEETGRRAEGELSDVFGGVLSDGGADTPVGIHALPFLVEQMRESGLSIDLDLSSDFPRLSPGLDLSIYRVVQEALTNSAKHAGPTNVRVRVECVEGAVLVDVDDDGPAQRTAGEQGRSSTDDPGSRGLLGIRERVNAYGGFVSARDDHPAGFSLHVRVPTGLDGQVAG